MGTGKWKLFDGWIAIFGWLDSNFLAVVSLKLTMFLFFFWEGTPKIISTTGISGILFWEGPPR